MCGRLERGRSRVKLWAFRQGRLLNAVVNALRLKPGQSFRSAQERDECYLKIIMFVLDTDRNAINKFAAKGSPSLLLWPTEYYGAAP